MKLENTIKVIKRIHLGDTVLLKVETFYHTYSKDAYIISYLFNYQIKKVEKIIVHEGFKKV